MQPDILFYLVGGVAVAILGLSKGGFAGVGTISTPLLALVIGPVAAAGVLLPILILQDLVAIAVYRRTFSAQILATMIPGAALGILLAYTFASRVPGWLVEIALGVVSLLFSFQQLHRQLGNPAVRTPMLTEKRWLGVVSGVGAGFTSTIAHAGTPPFQFYVMPKGLDRDMYVGTSVIFFAAMNWMKVPAFVALDQVTLRQLQASLVFVPLALISSWLGIRLVRAIDVRKFNLAISIILLGVSVMLIGQGVAGYLEAAPN